MKQDGTLVRPWYREFWPWVLILIPACSVAGSLVTIYLAHTTSSGLVVERGMSVDAATERKFALDDAARRLRVRAELLLDRELQRVSVSLASDAAGPARLEVRFSHPVHADRDQRIELTRARAGVYRGVLPASFPGRWYVTIGPTGEAAGEPWRLAGELLPDRARLTLAATPPGAAM